MDSNYRLTFPLRTTATPLTSRLQLRHGPLGRFEDVVCSQWFEHHVGDALGFEGLVEVGEGLVGHEDDRYVAELGVGAENADQTEGVGAGEVLVELGGAVFVLDGEVEAATDAAVEEDERGGLFEGEVHAVAGVV